MEADVQLFRITGSAEPKDLRAISRPARCPLVPLTFWERLTSAFTLVLTQMTDGT
jgi:hypothetical protein